MVVPRGEAKTRNRRIHRVAGCSEGFDILAAGFFAHLCALCRGVPDWRYSHGCEIPSGGSRIADALVVVERGCHLRAPHGRGVVDSRSDNPTDLFVNFRRAGDSRLLMSHEPRRMRSLGMRS